ncbi:MAG: hypothetical protein AAF721_10385 [Myxococcota bacterium]
MTHLYRPGTFGRVTALTLISGTLAFGAVPARANAAPEAGPPEAAPNPAIDSARSLFAAGLDRYDRADYAGAVVEWTAAYEAMAGVPELEASRHVLQFDLGQAQMRAYELDADAARLADAKPLLTSFLSWLARPGHTMTVGERHDRERARELLRQIDDASAPAAATTVEVNVNPAPRPLPQPIPPPHLPDPPSPSGTGLLVGGGLALGGAVASIASAFAFGASGRRAEQAFEEAPSEAEAREAVEQGRRSNVGRIVSVASAVAFTGAGAAMLAVGAKRRKRHISAGAALSPSMAAVSFSMRF